MAWTQERRNEWQREYRKRNGDRVRELERAAYARHREKNKQAAREYYARQKAWKHGWMNETKAFLGCFICGDENAHRLAWHHLTPLRDSDPQTRVGSILNNKGVEAALDEAMSHCVLLCANCHKDVHYWMEDAPNGL